MPLALPPGKRLAVSIGADFDAHCLWMGTFGLSSPSYLSRGEFGAEVGVPRLLELFGRHGIRTTWCTPSHTLRTVRGGRARGRLVGGNLTLISSLMGTPFEIDTRGKILLVEDVDEQPYSIDRMLTQLRLAGKLDAAAGIVFGECSGCRPADWRPSFESTLSLGEVLDEILGKLKIPVLSGLTFGHTADQLTLPLGAMASLDADKRELIIEEPGVR